MSDSCQLPDFDLDAAAAAAERLFNLSGPMQPLHGERDLNFLISAKRGKFVFKIANELESPAMLECQHRVFQRLADARVFPQVATALESVNGRLIETVQNAAGREHCCRVLPYLEGRMWSDVSDPQPELLQDIGHKLALLDQTLDGFTHPGIDRPLLWNMETALDVLERCKPALASDAQRALVEHFESGFRTRVHPLRDELRRAVIHNDANRENLLVDESGREVIGIIDFGDMLHIWLVVEPAIAITYAMLGHPDPMDVAKTLLRAYHRTLALSETEIGLVFDLVCMRLCTSVCICAYQSQLEPDNEYLHIDEQDNWVLLEQLRKIEYADAREALLKACHS